MGHGKMISYRNAMVRKQWHVHGLYTDSEQQKGYTLMQYSIQSIRYAIIECMFPAHP